MTTTPHTCESCSMPIESGHYCSYCVDENGDLQDFDVRFAKMVEWQLRRRPGRREDAEKATLDFMATMPAWRDHPRVAGR